MSDTTWQERWRLQKIAQLAAPMYESPMEYWHKTENVRRYMSHISGEFQDRVRRQIAIMQIPAGSRVLDIGAGPGTLSVPLACRGCYVTAIEPSILMRENMASFAREMNADYLTIIARRWEDVSSVTLGGPFDFVIASYSLSMMDIGKALRTMDEICSGTVNLFWFLTPSAWSQVKQDLWPRLHGSEFIGEPLADCLWQVLNETGIHANLTTGPLDPPVFFGSFEEAVAESCYRLHAANPDHTRIIHEYLKKKLRADNTGYFLGGNTRSARIWWNTSLEIEM